MVSDLLYSKTINPGGRFSPYYLHLKSGATWEIYEELLFSHRNVPFIGNETEFNERAYLHWLDF